MSKKRSEVVKRVSDNIYQNLVSILKEAHVTNSSEYNKISSSMGNRDLFLYDIFRRAVHDPRITSMVNAAAYFNCPIDELVSPPSSSKRNILTRRIFHNLMDILDEMRLEAPLDVMLTMLYKALDHVLPLEKTIPIDKHFCRYIVTEHRERLIPIDAPQKTEMEDA